MSSSAPGAGEWAERIAEHNDHVRAAGRWRSIRTLDSGAPSTTVTGTDASLTSFAANDYLGLSQHPDVVAAAHDALERWGAGSGAARLIVGSRPVHDELEEELARTSGREAALLFTSGFQANLGVLGALARTAPGCVIISDALNHASIIDGCRGSRAEVEIARHADAEHVRELLERHTGRPRIVVTDAVFSMDGDAAPLEELSAVCREHDALLVVDEAHAVLGPHAPPEAVVVGTLSKTLGAIGGFVAADRAVVDLCVNAARSFIFTTAGSPADAAAALAGLRILHGDEGERLRSRLRSNIELLAPGRRSPVVPIVLGDEARAVEVSEQLARRGYLVPAIRPPTVAPGTSRLRVALSAAHEASQVAGLRDALEGLGVEW